ncbi:hypothetical protein GCM10009859_16910 [Kocuria salsicia]|uniref:hypothetical protein n=1 Tax=Kocuria salsicia TaxID=664639 RepID=UPI0031DEF009
MAVQTPAQGSSTAGSVEWTAGAELEGSGGGAVVSAVAVGSVAGVSALSSGGAAWVLGAVLGVLLAAGAVLAAGDDAASAACEGSALCAQPTSSGTARTAAVRVLVFVEHISFTSSVGGDL